MQFELTILGSNSAIPANNRFPTAQILKVQDHLYLIDCGEGTQMRMNDYHIRRGKINQIFISHLHGDHIFGLIGLLTSYSLAGRTTALDIYSPIGLEEIINVQLKNTASWIDYPLHFHVIDTTKNELIFEDNILTVHTIPLIHRVPTAGFLFKEKEHPLNIIAEKIKTYDIPYDQIKAIKSGQDFTTADGKQIPNQELTKPPVPTRSYAYCSDTMYNEAIVPLINEVDLLYHETTFSHDKIEQAKSTMHSTAHQAATIAQMANVGQLIMGHYSSRYIDLTSLLEEAIKVFPNTVLGIEGGKYEVAFRNKK